MFAWPTLELTDYERKFVRIYGNSKYPGVLNRRYKVTLNSQEAPAKNLPNIKLADQIQIARRSRVYALTFTGNTDRWRLNISNASGTQYTNKSPRGQLDPVVTSMLPGNIHNALSMGGLVPPLTGALSPGIGPAMQSASYKFALQGTQPYPLLIDPNWVLLPNESLIFNGTPIPISYEDGEETINPNLVLTICAHVWEFPNMGTADISEVI